MITDGDIDMSEATGQWNVVADVAKSAQDMARELLIEYNAYFSEGNELLDMAGSSDSYGLTESLVYQYLYECITRLISRQRSSNFDERILSIQNIRVEVVGSSTAIFMVEVLYTSGETVTVVEAISRKPTSLNQQAVNPAELIGVS